MESQCILSKVPKYSKVYIFGSALYTEKPSDLDVLIEYDSDAYDPSKAYEIHRCFLECLQKVINLEIDVTLLSKKENDSIVFKELIGLAPLESTIRFLLDKFRKQK